MSDELPDILGEDLGYLLGWVALGATNDDGCEAARVIGAEILGCHEMQAIKAVLRHHAKESALTASQPAGTAASMREVLAVSLPDLVVEWVLS